MNILGLEVSTSSAKAVIYSSQAGVLAVHSIPYDEKTNNVVTQDPEGMYKTLKECVKGVLEKKQVAIDGIGLSSTWHSLLLLDEERKPLGRILSWANTEAADTVFKHRRDEGLKKWLYQKTGCVIHSMYPLWKFKSIAVKRPELLSKARYLSSQPEYVFEKLTGAVGISRSSASGSGLFNIHRLDWDEEVLDFAGIKREMLSPLRESEFYAPLSKQAAAELGLPAGTPVVIGGPDGALNQIGSGAMKAGIMTMSVGTSGALRIAVDSPVLPDNPSTWCYYVSEGKRLAGAATSGAGNCVDWFMKKVNSGRLSYQELEDSIGIKEQEEAPIFLPFLYGERCPGWMDDRTGGYQGLRGDHGLGHLYYAILEGVLFNLYQCYNIFVELGQEPKEIRISGGIENSEKWLQMAADIFQREIQTSELEHASVMGAIALAFKALGGINSLQEYQSRIVKRIQPNPEMEKLYRRRFGRYMEAYEKNGYGGGNNE